MKTLQDYEEASLEEKAKWVNSQLNAGIKRKDLGVVLGVKDWRITQPLTQAGYKLIKGQYVYCEEKEESVMDKVEKIEGLAELMEHKDALIALVTKKQEGFDYNRVKELESSVTKPVTIRIEENILTEFEAFAKSLSLIGKDKLISLALKDFMAKYK